MHQPLHQSDRTPAARNPASPSTDLRTLCAHFFPDNHQCGSPALRGQRFCYYHHPTRTRVSNANERRARRIARQSFNLPLPTSPHELQRSISEIARRIAANQIDLRRAGLLLFAIQSAAKNLNR